METTKKTNYETKWEEYQFDVNQPLLTRDVYAYFGKGGTPEFISQKMSELTGFNVQIPQRIKNDDLWNNFVKPFRELPQEKQTELKTALIQNLENSKKQVQEETPQTLEEKMANFSDFYSNQYEINADKQLNPHDIFAFLLQYGKGAKAKLTEILKDFLGYDVSIDKLQKEEFYNKIIQPIQMKGVFGTSDFKNKLIENLDLQKAFKEEQELDSQKDMLLFNKVDRKLYIIDIEQDNKNIVMKGVSIEHQNNEQKIFSLQEWNQWKVDNAKDIVTGKSNTYQQGDEFIFNFGNEQEVYKLVEIKENKEQPLLDLYKLQNQTEGKESFENLYKFDIDFHIAQNKVKQLTPEMKEKGFYLEKDYEGFHKQHLKGLDPNIGLSDKNIYAILNTEVGSTIEPIRNQMLEQYLKLPFDDIKKLKKADMIEKVYELKKEGKDFETTFKTDIQKIYLLSKANMNSIAPEQYQQYLQELSYPDKKIWELEHIDKFLIQDADLPKLIEGTALENDSRCQKILQNFNEDKEFILHSKSFHTGDEQIRDKQYLLNVINHSENKEMIKKQLIESIEQQKEQVFQLKR